MASNDADFETKAADIVGLYLNPLAYAAVLCVDEQTAIQASERIASRTTGMAPCRRTPSSTGKPVRSWEGRSQRRTSV
jgi:hypothetical protein